MHAISHFGYRGIQYIVLAIESIVPPTHEYVLVVNDEAMITANAYEVYSYFFVSPLYSPSTLKVRVPGIFVCLD